MFVFKKREEEDTNVSVLDDHFVNVCVLMYVRTFVYVCMLMYVRTCAYTLYVDVCEDMCIYVCLCM